MTNMKELNESSVNRKSKMTLTRNEDLRYEID